MKIISRGIDMNLTSTIMKAALVLIAACAGAVNAQAQMAYGITAIVNLTDTAISTYSATELDYWADAYYDAYVEGYLFQNGWLYGWGSASSGSFSNIAYGYMNKPAVTGAVYQIESDHYVMAAYAYTDYYGISYYSNPLGYYFLPAGGGGQAVSGTPYGPAGGPTYVTVQYGYLGTTAVRADTPTALLTNGSLDNATAEWSSNGDGTYNVNVSGAAYNILEEYNLLQSAGVISFPPCTIGEPRLCAVWNGVRVLVQVGVLAGAAIQGLNSIWSERVPSPYGWPGDDGAVAPGSDWTWQGNGPPGSSEGNWVKNNPNGRPESLHPDLNHAAPKAPHWDYKDPGGKWWDVWKDGTMTPKR